MSLILFCLVGLVGLAAAGEEPLPPPMDPHHHVTTVCIQVHGHSPMCGPMVNPEAALSSPQEAARGSPMMASAARGPDQPMFQPARGSDQPMFQPARGSDQPMMAQPARQSQFQPSDAVLQGFYGEVPVYRMSSAGDAKSQQQIPKPNQPCPEPSSRSAGSVVSVVQPNSGFGYHTPLIGGGLGLGGVGGVGLQQPSIVTVQQPGYIRSNDPSARTIPIAPWGVEPQQQQMRASQFAAARSQQMAAMRSAGNVPDCPDDHPQFQAQMRAPAAGRFQGQQQQQMRQIFPSQSYSSMRETQSDLLARQCAEQEMEIKKKTDEISDLKKQLDRLTSMTEKTTIEQKTVSVKSSSSSDSLQQKDTSEDKKDAQPVIKKKK